MIAKRLLLALCMALVLATGACVPASPAATISSVNAATATQAYWATALAGRYARPSPTGTPALGPTQASWATALAQRYSSPPGPTWTPSPFNQWYELSAANGKLLLKKATIGNTFHDVATNQTFYPASPDYKFVIMEFRHSGDIAKIWLLDGPFRRSNSLFLSSDKQPKGTKYTAIDVHVGPQQYATYLLFTVPKDDKGPWTLVNVLDKWQILINNPSR